MMKLFKKDPARQAKRQYERLMKQSMEAQRAGDVVRSAELYDEAQKLHQAPSSDSAN